MELGIGILTAIAIFLPLMFAIILIIRWLGAWMLRIDEVIKVQNQTLGELRRISKKLDSKEKSDSDSQDLV